MATEGSRSDTRSPWDVVQVLRDCLALFGASLVLASASPRAQAAVATIVVPGDYATIQAAIHAAQPGDTVLVHPGVYAEAVNFLGRDIVVRSSMGPEHTFLDGQGLFTVVTFEGGEGPAAILEGFTVRNGVAELPARGGGIHCELSSPTIRDCVVRGNRGGDGNYGPITTGGAGGIGSHGASPTIDGCVVEMNVGGAAFSSRAGAGGILIDDSGSQFYGDPGAVLRNTVIRANQGGPFTTAVTAAGVGGVHIESSRNVLLEECTVSENRGGPDAGNDSGETPGGVLLRSSEAHLVSCEITHNLGTSAQLQAGCGGTGGVSVQGNASVFPFVPSTITNCVIAWNIGGDTPGGSCAGTGGLDVFGAEVRVTNCTVVGNHGGEALAHPQGFGGTGGLHFQGGHPGPSHVTNTLFWTNDKPGWFQDGIQVFSGPDPILTNNLNPIVDFTDPRLVDAAGGDFRLACDSPAIDAGSTSAPGVPATDFEGDPRPSGLEVDIGADEFTGTPSVFPTFCTALANSSGQPASIGGEGCLSIAENNMRVVLSGLPDTPGLLFYGPNPIQASFGDGFRCVGGATRRLPPMPGMGASISIALDLPSLQLQPGTPSYFQYWYRDPAAGGAGFNLSDGLEVRPEP